MYIVFELTRSRCTPVLIPIFYWFLCETSVSRLLTLVVISSYYFFIVNCAIKCNNSFVYGYIGPYSIKAFQCLELLVKIVHRRTSSEHGFDTFQSFDQIPSRSRPTGNQFDSFVSEAGKCVITALIPAANNSSLLST